MPTPNSAFGLPNSAAALGNYTATAGGMPTQRASAPGTTGTVAPNPTGTGTAPTPTGTTPGAGATGIIEGPPTGWNAGIGATGTGPYLPMPLGNYQPAPNGMIMPNTGGTASPWLGPPTGLGGGAGGSTLLNLGRLLAPQGPGTGIAMPAGGPFGTALPSQSFGGGMINPNVLGMYLMGLLGGQTGRGTMPYWGSQF